MVLSHPDPRRVGDEAALVKLASGQAVGLSRPRAEFRGIRPGGGVPPSGRYLPEPQPPQAQPGPEPGSVLLDRSGSRPGSLPAVRRSGRAGLSPPSRSRAVVGSSGAGAGASLCCCIRSIPSGLGARLRSGGRVGGPCCGCGRRSARRPGSTSPCCCAARPAPARSSWPAPSTRQAKRRQGPYVAVNMAALPPSLAAAELFGRGSRCLHRGRPHEDRLLPKRPGRDPLPR